MSSDFADAVAREIRAARSRAGLTQVELAERLGWGRNVVGHVEAGSRSVRLEEVPALCRALGVDLAELIGRVPAADLDALGMAHERTTDVRRRRQ